jgi:hypothetical protein
MNGKVEALGLENQHYGRGDPLHTLYLLKLALTLPTVGGRSVDIVRLTKDTEFSLVRDNHRISVEHNLKTSMLC